MAPIVPYMEQGFKEEVQHTQVWPQRQPAIQLRCLRSVTEIIVESCHRVLVIIVQNDVESRGLKVAKGDHAVRSVSTVSTSVRKCFNPTASVSDQRSTTDRTDQQKLSHNLSFDGPKGELEGIPRTGYRR